MKRILTLLTLFCCCVFTYGQSTICDSLLNIRTNERVIIDTASFCAGIEQAINYNGLALRSVGDPDHLTHCEFLSYEKFGVELIMTGDIVFTQQLDENDGFNAIMTPKIKDSLGEQYLKLGVVDSIWNDLNLQTFMTEFIACLEPFEVLSDSTVHFKLSPTTEANSIFKTFEGIKFYDINKRIYDRKDLYSGVILPLKGNRRLYLIVDFSEYSNPNNICQATNRMVIPIDLSD